MKIVYSNYFIKSRLCFKKFLIYSSGSPFDRLSETICEILVRCIMRNNSVELFKVGPVFQEEMSFKDISYLELWWPLCLAKQNHLSNFCRKRHE